MSATLLLKKAVKQGKVEVTMNGLGESTGDAIVITLNIGVSYTLRLKLEAGTVLPEILELYRI